MTPKANAKSDNGGANLGFEAAMWAAADKLRNNMDAGEYKHVVLGLIFLKYISDAFEAHRQKLERGTADPRSELYIKKPRARYEVLEDRDEYLAENVFWVPKEARWVRLQAKAKQPTIGMLIDDAMAAIERDNPSLKAVLPKDYARPTLDKQRLGELIDLISTIGLGDDESRSKDILGRVYEYFLSQFASAEGKKGGQFYTPRSVVGVLVEMLAPYKGRVFDPCCGSGGMFVQSEKFVEAHGGRIGDISIYGQESNATTWRLAKMNLAIRGFEANLGEPDTAGSFRHDQFPDLKADYVLANPPFNDSDWAGEQLREDVRWKYGVPPAGNANYAWVQHFIHHLSPSGVAGFVLANGALSAAGTQGNIRQSIIEDDLVDCIVVLAPKLFYTVQTPASLWLLTRSKDADGARSRRRETLFIDARKCYEKVGPKQNRLTDEHIDLIAGTYSAWKSPEAGYQDVIGFCKSVTIDGIAECENSLVPARHVGITVDPPNAVETSRQLNRAVEEIRVTLGRMRKLSDQVEDALELTDGR